MDQATIARHTLQLAGEGVRLLNFWRLAPTEIQHANALLDLMELPLGARVVDLGSGTGEFARLAMQLRPDLHFTLVNNSQWQLDQSPEGCSRVLADMQDTGLPYGCYDAVVLAYAAGHADLVDTMKEAESLLRNGGKLVVHQPFTDSEVRQGLFKERFDFRLHGRSAVRYAAQIIGFDFVSFSPDHYLAPGATVDIVNRMGFFDGLEHGVMLFTKSGRGNRFEGKKVALSFSGGKDSLACLYLMKPWLPHLTVYWLNTGDTCPETETVVALIRERVPRFVEINSNVTAWREKHGMPTDLLPAKSHMLGVAYGMSDVKMVGRFDCCYHNLMKPLHDKLQADQVDVVIRGTKLSDTGKLPHEGKSQFYDVMLPLRDWSHDEVFDFLDACDAPVNPIYEHFKGISAPECMGCTAWWDDNKAAYLKARHPEKVGEYRVKLSQIRAALKSHLADLDRELGGA